MRFEAKNTLHADNADADVMTPKIAFNSSPESFDLSESDLPDDFQELAAQLSADADRLTGFYPAQAHGEFAVGGLVRENEAGQPGRVMAAVPWRWMKQAPRVAAVIGLLAGLTLIVGYSSAWRGMLAGKAGASPTSTAAPLAAAETGKASDSSPAETASTGRPVSISAEALRLSGEEMEILRHATEGEVVEVDI